MISHVLVAIDDSEMANRALEYAFEAHPHAEITVLHVVGKPSGMMGAVTALSLADDLEEKADEYAKDVLDSARECATEHDRDITTVVDVGPPAKMIVKRAEDYDVLVIGTHSGTLADRLLVGNVAEKVFRNSPVPVTVVR